MFRVQPNSFQMLYTTHILHRLCEGGKVTKWGKGLDEGVIACGTSRCDQKAKK